jgi:hypothetical protein
MSLIGSLIRSFVEGRASRASLDEIHKGLETNGGEVANRMASVADTPANRQQAGHIIGIERWGVQRLRSALAPNPAPAKDEYDSYRPRADQPVSALALEFKSARAETLSLLEPLGQVQDCRVLHNDLGPLSVRGWLVYLTNHASMESKRLK